MILPNKPVVKDKADEQNQMFPEQPVLGVYKGVTIAQIKAYLLSDVKYKKITTTPEGFIHKVVKAFKNLSVMYGQFYMLIDESERVITDVSWRGAIAAPLKHFFLFERKGMVSATTLPLSDSRLDKFTGYVIEPQFDYSRKLTRVNTNNVIQSLKLKLEALDSDHVAIFFNSTKGISAVIKALGLKSNYIIFCAEDSVVKLIDDGIVPYQRATEVFTADKMQRYNFFTSRYFSAIDIKLDYKPDIFLISDIFFADHSMLDPKTEAIQIPGRFRNGINSLTHITNFNPRLITKTPNEARFYLEGLFEAYDDFNKAYQKTTNPGKKDAYYKAMTESKAHSFWMEGELNPAMVSNFYHEERVKEYYKNPVNLKKAYAEKKKHFIVRNEEDLFDAGDDDLFSLEKGATKKERFENAALLLYRYKQRSHTHFFLFKPTNIIAKVRAKYPEIAEGVDYLDPSILERTNYVLSEIKQAVKSEKQKRETVRIAKYIYQHVEPQSKLFQTELKEIMIQAYHDAKTQRKVIVNDILLFFNGFRTTEKKKNVYKLDARILEYNTDSER